MSLSFAACNYQKPANKRGQELERFALIFPDGDIRAKEMA
jgi:hypothetical protein